MAARAAGVLFTTFPEYPLELAIHAVAGLGEGLAGGQLMPEEYYLNKKDGKLVQFTPITGPSPGGASDGGKRAAQPCRPGRIIHRYAQRLETARGGPQDVEFAQDEAGKTWLVQPRPLTQPVPEVLVFDNANIQESYCGVTTPLSFSFSFAQRAYATVYRQTMRALGLPAATVAAHEAVVTSLLALRQGRICYNLSN